MSKLLLFGCSDFFVEHEPLKQTCIFVMWIAYYVALVTVTLPIGGIISTADRQYLTHNAVYTGCSQVYFV